MLAKRRYKATMPMIVSVATDSTWRTMYSRGHAEIVPAVVDDEEYDETSGWPDVWTKLMGGGRRSAGSDSTTLLSQLVERREATYSREVC